MKGGMEKPETTKDTKAHKGPRVQGIPSCNFVCFVVNEWVQ